MDGGVLSHRKKLYHNKRCIHIENGPKMEFLFIHIEMNHIENVDMIHIDSCRYESYQQATI